MSIAHCNECDLLVEGQTEECHECGAELCPYCGEEVTYLREERTDYERSDRFH